MAARLAPANTSATHQSLLHFVGESPWRDDRVLEAVRDQVLPALEAAGGIEAWIIDDTSFPKKGRHSVGVARQYCGQLGKTENCQVAVSLSVASARASLPVAWRLYLPEDWVGDAARRRKTGIPDDIGFRTKPEIALEQIREALSMGLPPGVALADASYGNDTRFRDELTMAWPSTPHACVAGVRRPCWRRGQRRAGATGAQPRSLNGGGAGGRPGRGAGILTWAGAAARRPSARATTSGGPCPRTWLERMVQLIKLRWRIERDIGRHGHRASRRSARRWPSGWSP